MAYKTLVANMILNNQKFNTKLKQTANQITKFNKQLRAVNTALRFDPKNLDLIRHKQELLNKRYEISASLLNQQKARYEALIRSQQQGNKVLQRDLNKHYNSYKKLEEQTIRYHNQLKQVNYQLAITGKSSRFFYSLERAAERAKLATLGVSIATALSLRTFKSYYEGLGKIATITPKAYASSEKLSNELIKISNETGVAATELTEGLYQAISTGLPTTKDGVEELKHLTTAAKLAVAGNAELGNTVTVLNGVINAYGKEWSDAEVIVNDFMTMIRLGKVEMNEIAESFGNLSPLAAAAKVPFKEIAASLATATKKGQKFANAVTGMRALLTQLLRPSSKLSQKVEELFGENFEELIKKGTPIIDIFGKVYKSVGGKASKINELTGRIRAGTNMMAIFGEDGKLFNQTLKEFETNAGEAGKAFNKQLPFRSMSLSLNKFKNAILQTGKVIFKAFEPIIDVFAKFAMYLSENNIAATVFGNTVAGLVLTLGSLKIISKVSKAFTGLKAVIYGLPIAVKAFQTAILSKSLFAGFATLKTAVLAAAGSFTTLQLSMGWIGAIGIAVAAIIVNFEKLRDILQSIIDLIAKVTGVDKQIHNKLAKYKGSIYTDPTNFLKEQEIQEARAVENRFGQVVNNTFNISADAVISEERLEEIADKIGLSVARG